MAIDLAHPASMLTTRLRQAINWGRKHSLWTMPYGTACCAVELAAASFGSHDLDRFGAGLVGYPPRQSDLMIVAGTISAKQAPLLKSIYAQMRAPKWVIAMGACACSGGFYRNYGTVQGVDRIIPTDIYVAGCPPTPENLVSGLLLLQRKIETEGLPCGGEPRAGGEQSVGDRPGGRHER